MGGPAGRSAVSLAVAGLRFAFPGGEPVLEDFEVAVGANSVLALLGPSGCGKTTLLRVVAGLETPSAGTVVLGDRVLTDGSGTLPPEKRGIGMVFQDWALFPHLDVAANIAFGLPRTRRRDPSVVQDTLGTVGLEGLGGRMPAELSGGQQQRVALGRALAQQPELLLLDEPFSNLDPSLRARVRSDVHRLLGEIGITTVIVTHDRDEAFVLGDSVAVMRDGAVVQQGPPAEVYGAPVDRWCAEFLGDANLLAGDATGTVADTPLGRLALSTARRGAVLVVVRPEQVTVLEADRAEFCGVVRDVEYHGPRTHYVVDVPGGSIRIEEPGGPRWLVGQDVGVRVTDSVFAAVVP